MTGRDDALDQQIRESLHRQAETVTPSPMSAATIFEMASEFGEPDGQPATSTKPGQRWPIRLAIAACVLAVVGVAVLIGRQQPGSELKPADTIPVEPAPSDTADDDVEDSEIEDGAGQLPVADQATAPGQDPVEEEQGVEQSESLDVPVTSSETTDPADPGPIGGSTSAPADASTEVDLTITTPEAGQVYSADAAVPITGIASSTNGRVALIRIVVFDRQASAYRQADGSFSKTWHTTEADIERTAEQPRNWSSQIDALPPGEYEIRVRAIDHLQNRTDWIVIPFSTS